MIDLFRRLFAGHHLHNDPVDLVVDAVQFYLPMTLDRVQSAGLFPNLTCVQLW